jgi:RHS repeat-associated protein
MQLNRPFGRGRATWTRNRTYDAEGNRLTRTKTATGEVTEYTWDYHNRLTKVTEKNSQGTVTQVVEYLYDVFNRRIGRKIDTSTPFDMANAVIERYVLDDIHNGLTSADGGNVVLDFVDTDGNGAQSIAMSKRYLYGEAVDQLFAQEDLSKTLGDTSRNLWPLVDHLGTVRDLAKQDGTIAAHFKYDSFGNVTSGDTSKTRYLFTSREFDSATKLQYNRARYYDAAVGRWISEDPLGFAAGDTNVGRYVTNLPMELTDPSGLEWRFKPDPRLKKGQMAQTRKDFVETIAKMKQMGGIIGVVADELEEPVTDEKDKEYRFEIIVGPRPPMAKIKQPEGEPRQIYLPPDRDFYPDDPEDPDKDTFPGGNTPNGRIPDIDRRIIIIVHEVAHARFVLEDPVNVNIENMAREQLGNGVPIRKRYEWPGGTSEDVPKLPNKDRNRVKTFIESWNARQSGLK